MLEEHDENCDPVAELIAFETEPVSVVPLVIWMEMKVERLEIDSHKLE